MDGTLIDSMEMISRVDEENFEKLGITPNDEILDDMRYIPLGESAEYIKEHFDLPLTAEEIMQVMLDSMIEGYRDVEMKEGVFDYLDFCRKNGIKMAIATATEPDLAVDIAKNMGFYGYMEAIVSCTDVGAPKNRPDVFIEAARKMGLESSECAVFEDGLPGAVSSGEAGFTVVGVYDPTAGEEDSAKLRAASHRYIKSFREIENQLI